MTMLLSGYYYGSSNVTLMWLNANKWITNASSADSELNWLIQVMLDHLQD